MTAAKDPDFYAVLGVPRTATETEARTQWRSSRAYNALLLV